jgi:hypothetical protein
VQNATDDAPIIHPRLAGLAFRQMDIDGRPSRIRQPKQMRHLHLLTDTTQSEGKNLNKSRMLFEFPT